MFRCQDQAQRASLIELQPSESFYREENLWD
jgi:hypothetical protein